MVEYNGYIIVPDGAFSMVQIKSKGKGAVPKELRGQFTSGGVAKRAIDHFGKRKEDTSGDKSE